MEKIPNWARYILAIPAGLIAVIIVGFFVQFSNLLVSDPNSLNMNIVTFLYRNGVNTIVFFWTINYILPSHKFLITLIISIGFGIFYSIIEGMAIMQEMISLEYILAFIELIACLIISCYLSFTSKFNIDDDQ